MRVDFKNQFIIKHIFVVLLFKDKSRIVLNNLFKRNAYTVALILGHSTVTRKFRLTVFSFSLYKAQLLLLFYLKKNQNQQKHLSIWNPLFFDKI